MFKAVLTYTMRPHRRPDKQVIENYINICTHCDVRCQARTKVEVRDRIIRFYGTTYAFGEMIERLKENYVYVRLLKRKLYMRGLTLQFIKGIGWTQKPH